MRIPLAWLNLVQNKARLLASVGGVAFAVVLMFLEMGFLNGLYDSQTEVVKKMNADLVLVHAQKEAVVPKLPFPKKRLAQARGHPGVAAAYALYVEEFRAVWKNALTHKEYPILVFGFDPDEPVFLIPEVAANADALKVADTALIDAHSKNFFGDLRPGVEAELSRRKVRVVGTFPLGADFRVDGNVLVSDSTFFNCFRASESARVEFGLLKVTPGYDPREVRQSLSDSLPDDVSVLTREEFMDRVKKYWGESKPVGYVFILGTVVGFLIGVTICYQILYTDIADQLPQYATLKAIGYTNGYLVKVVLSEAVYLAVLGFAPGLLISLGLYAALQWASGVLMRLTPERAALVFVLTVAMCVVSGAIAIRKVMNSDPAEVF